MVSDSYGVPLTPAWRLEHVRAGDRVLVELGRVDFERDEPLDQTIIAAGALAQAHYAAANVRAQYHDPFNAATLREMFASIDWAVRNDGEAAEAVEGLRRALGIKGS